MRLIKEGWQFDRRLLSSARNQLFRISFSIQVKKASSARNDFNWCWMGRCENAFLFFKLRAAICLLLLSGCTSIFYNSDSNLNLANYGCKYVDGHFDNNETFIPSGLVCPRSTPSDSLSENECKWKASYYRNDGVLVEGHYRCSPKKNHLTPNFGGNCHYVSSYYRKDGTYVRGYTRCRK
ncbi:hypothetical protein [Pleionea sediminis]|uniref:hypothetical protein n=1 Tax=Pleionea sediminis TaxID=2569479 RepID=UPI001187181D|nr:hypothetical protein [Pleionea sediminis]